MIGIKARQRPATAGRVAGAVKQAVRSNRGKVGRSVGRASNSSGRAPSRPGVLPCATLFGHEGSLGPARRVFQCSKTDRARTRLPPARGGTLRRELGGECCAGVARSCKTDFMANHFQGRANTSIALDWAR